MKPTLQTGEKVNEEIVEIAGASRPYRRGEALKVDGF
jgi:hypothetical protein